MFFATATYNNFAYVLGGDTDGAFGGAVNTVYYMSTIPLVNFTTTSLDAIAVNAPYTKTLTIADGVAPYSFSIVSGALPTGLSLASGTGTISGTPTATGSYNFTIRVTDATSTQIDQTYTQIVLDDLDGDSIADAVESASPLGGDVNADSIADNLQPIVATTLNPVNNAYITSVVDNCASGFTSFSNQAESALNLQDKSYTYPLGLQNFTVNCGAIGATATFTHYLDKVYDTKGWKYRKYLSAKGYVDVTSQVVLGTATVNGKTVTTVRFSVTDGSEYDNDGLANGSISDPIGAAVLIDSLANTGMYFGVMLLVAVALLCISMTTSAYILLKKPVLVRQKINEK